MLGMSPEALGLRWDAARLQQMQGGPDSLPGLCGQETLDLAGSRTSHVARPEEKGAWKDLQEHQEGAAKSCTNDAL
jgi:hypothetical protein